MVWFIAVGSAAGGALRYLLGLFIQQRLGGTFPLGTLVINVSGSLLLGFLLHYALATPAISPELRGLLTSGFCGGYTTFSTFSYESLSMLEEGDYRHAALYIALSILVSLAGVYLGITLARETLALRERM
ncbi:MAG TPA: fluoride efflux transporter CrcB [Gemmatimonadaceae bacterium]|jgi:CrcB protein|nr:fluoride efflux transporter CrcB [Gemmatimonadaceae bacterium]